jgi:hypothetical protein
VSNPSYDLAAVVARSADAADLHATVPALLIELQMQLGALSASVTVNTERGRRPFRPDAIWAARLGELAYGVYLLADQTGVNVTDAVLATAVQLHSQAAQAPGGPDLPF